MSFLRGFRLECVDVKAWDDKTVSRLGTWAQICGMCNFIVTGDL